MSTTSDPQIKNAQTEKDSKLRHYPPKTKKTWTPKWLHYKFLGLTSTIFVKPHSIYQENSVENREAIDSSEATLPGWGDAWRTENIILL